MSSAVVIRSARTAVAFGTLRTAVCALVWCAVWVHDSSCGWIARPRHNVGTRDDRHGGHRVFLSDDNDDCHTLFSPPCKIPRNIFHVLAEGRTRCWRARTVLSKITIFKLSNRYRNHAHYTNFNAYIPTVQDAVLQPAVFPTPTP